MTRALAAGWGAAAHQVPASALSRGCPFTVSHIRGYRGRAEAPQLGIEGGTVCGNMSQLKTGTPKQTCERYPKLVEPVPHVEPVDSATHIHMVNQDKGE